MSLEVRDPCLVSVVPEDEKYCGDDPMAAIDYEALIMIIRDSSSDCHIESIGVASVDEVSDVVKMLLGRNRSPIVASVDVERLLETAGVPWLVSLVAHDDPRTLVDAGALLRAMNMILGVSSAPLSAAIPSMSKERFAAYYDRDHLIFKGPG